MQDDMEQIFQIEQACASNDNETVMSVLESIDSLDIKKQAFLKIIEYHETRSRFPVGYMFLFMKWLLQNNDRKTAMEYILKCRQNGVDEARISHVIYESVIKPDEAFYRENFNKNLQMLQKHKVLFYNQVFDFEQLKKEVLMVADCQLTVPDDLQKELCNKDKISLMVDVTDMKLPIKLLNAVNFTYLVYDDVRLFYYLLLFEDFSGISGHIKQRKIVFFDGTDKALLKDFFLNLSVIFPNTVFGKTNVDKYNEILGEIRSLRAHKVSSIAKALDAYYKDHNHQYYRDLFVKDPSGTKILLIATENTEINKFITKNWHEAFRKLGYNTRFLIEKEPFEQVTNHYIHEAIHEFKPDVVFIINWCVSTFLGKGEARKNLLWIMRYRDSVGCELHHAKPGYEYNNMFILPILFEWTEKLRDIGIPENRIFNTSDGININLIAKKNEVNRSYVCDIVSVNNAVGSESFRLNYYFQVMTNESYKKTVIEVLDRFKERLNNEKTVFAMPDKKQFIKEFKEKLSVYGYRLNDESTKVTVNLFDHIIDSFCRGKIMEWIVDSGITTNIKLWGKGWSNHEKFKKFHMGIARHGEELISIYRGSEISISDALWGLHERNFEIFASGGFPIIRHVEWPEIENPNKITNYFRENEEVVMFYSKDDLLNKIQYYLDNPEERERIAENGRQVVINNFSHIAIARKTMDFIKDYYRD